MSYTISWHSQNIVAYAHFTGEFAEDEVERFNIEFREQFLAQGDQPVHLIMNVRNVVVYPHNVWAIRHAFNDYLNHPALGWLLAIGGRNVFMIFLEVALMQILGSRFRHVSSLNEAMNVIRRVDDRLTEYVNIGQ